jgi:hypothetical protein
MFKVNGAGPEAVALPCLEFHDLNVGPATTNLYQNLIDTMDEAGGQPVHLTKKPQSLAKQRPGTRRAGPLGKARHFCRASCQRNSYAWYFFARCIRYEVAFG